MKQGAARRIAALVLPWLAFVAVLAWAWRIGNPFTDLPGPYSDLLEVLWGIDFYYDALFVRRASPLFTPSAFHPGGWQTATLAHTPALFLLAQPLRALGSAAFAINALILFSTGVAFAGSFRLARLFASPFPATVCALVYAFWAGRWFNAGAGHLNVLWLSSLLPWFAWSLERLRRDAGNRRRWIWISGLVWGLMINAVLQSVLIGAVVFLVWGRSLFSASSLKRLAGIACIAAAVSTPSWLPFVLATAQGGVAFANAQHISFWGASLNSLFIASLSHPIPFVKDLVDRAYSGLATEAVKWNLGWVTGALGLAGAIIALRQRSPAVRFAGLALASLVLALGLQLRWNGEPVASPLFAPLNEWIWQVGRALKPRVFDWLAPPPSLENGVPLPSLVLTALVPLWEAGRVMSRFALVAAVALIPLAAAALQSMRAPLRWLVVGLWLLEGLPAPTDSYPVPKIVHPAYAWIAGQSLAPGEGVAEMDYRTLTMASEALYATTFHHKPTASGIGTFWPLASIPLRDFIETNAQTALETPGAAHMLSSYGVRYILLELKGDREKRIWQQALNHPDFKPVRCFPPPAAPTPWPNPICVIEVKPAAPAALDELHLGAGWQPAEAWGTWAEGQQAHAGWFSDGTESYRLDIEAFPLCVPGRQQAMSVEVNGAHVGSHTWQACEAWTGQITIPAGVARLGWNHLRLQFAHAAKPAEVDPKASGDYRDLSVGFTKLALSPAPENPEDEPHQ